MPRRAPRVSIGLPVLNGEDHLARALDSCVSQDFDDIEVVVCDNGSTDATPDIAREYARNDERVRYYRREETVPAWHSFEWTWQLASETEYFKWAAHDDAFDPSFVRRCVERLDADPSAVLCFTGVAYHDDTEEIRKTIVEDDIDAAASHNVYRRFHDVIWNLTEIAAPVFGLVRSDAMRRSGRLRNTPEPDRVLLGELAVMGPVLYIPEVLFLRYMGSKKRLRDSWLWLDPGNVDRPKHAVIRFLGHHLNFIAQSNEDPLGMAILAGDLLGGTVARRLWYKVGLGVVEGRYRRRRERARRKAELTVEELAR